MAYKTGVLTGKDQSRIQRWALGYYQFSERRDQVEQQMELKKLLHAILIGTDRKLYQAAFPDAEVDDPDVVPGHTYGVEDLGDLESVIKKLGSMSTTTQESLDKNKWTDWR